MLIIFKVEELLLGASEFGLFIEYSSLKAVVALFGTTVDIPKLGQGTPDLAEQRGNRVTAASYDIYFERI